MDMLYGKKLMAKDGTLHPVKNVLKNKRIFIYLFSASFVEKRDFMQKLKYLYQENIKRSKHFKENYKVNENVSILDSGMEIIYVSADTNENSYRHDFVTEQGPWLAIPFKDQVASELRFMLLLQSYSDDNSFFFLTFRYKYDITSMPTLIVVNKDGDIITRSGREELEEIGINVIVTWTEYIQQ